jgi:5-methyltetrahydropteroyltriglutamate--homocysteine methyltransferase
LSTSPTAITNRFPLASAELPLISTSTIGSHAPMGWLSSVVKGIRAGDYGEQDIEEALTDAVDLAVLEQQRAGIDILVDGEMRRIDFNLGFYGRIQGLEQMPAPRRLGPEGHDQRGKWKVVQELSVPNGLGVVEEFSYLLRIADRPVKATVPGPFTLSGRLALNGVYKDRLEAAWALQPAVTDELRRLTEIGADFIYVDEPSIAVYPEYLRESIKLFNATVKGINARIGTHLCFGNFRGRPVAHRTYAPLFPAVMELTVDELSLELANREMAELELLREFAQGRGKTLAAGVVDVKNYWCEPPEVVADRIRQILRYVPAEKLAVTPDCGMSQTARWAAQKKLVAMVEGTKTVRRELTGAEA